MKGKIVLASGSDQGYFPGLIVSVLSAIQNSQRILESPLDIHILDGGIEENSWMLLVNEVRKLNRAANIFRHPTEFPDWDNVPKIWGNSLMAYARILLPELVPDPQIIYFDSDILVMADLGELFDRPFEDSVTTYACMDTKIQWLKNDCKWLEGEAIDGLAYFNSGLLKIDLDAWRALRVTDQCKRLILEHPDYCRFWDQSVLNYVLKGKWNRLEQRFNANVFSFHHYLHDFEIGNANLHFVTARKPWNTYSNCFEFQIWNTYLKIKLPQLRRSTTVAKNRSKTVVPYLKETLLEQCRWIRNAYLFTLRLIRKLHPSFIPKTDYVFRHWNEFNKANSLKGTIDPARAKALLARLKTQWSS